MEEVDRFKADIPFKDRGCLGAVIFLDSLLNFHTKNESILDMTFSG